MGPVMDAPGLRLINDSNCFCEDVRDVFFFFASSSFRSCTSCHVRMKTIEVNLKHSIAAGCCLTPLKCAFLQLLGAVFM